MSSGRLSGQRVVVTRAAHQAEELAVPLRAMGAEVILLATIAIRPPMNQQPLITAATNLERYDWIVFTSSNAVDAIAGMRTGAPSGPKVACVGEATARHAQMRGFQVDLVPEKYIAEALVEAFGSQELNGNSILIPSAAVNRDVVPRELRKRGARVDVVEAYRNSIPEEAASEAARVLRDPFPDWITFASPSAIDHLVTIAGAGTIRRCRLATVGPVTSRAVRSHGLAVAVEASPHTVQGLVDAMASCIQTS